MEERRDQDEASPKEAIDAGTPAQPVLPADTPPSTRPGEAMPRPPSLQADEGQRDAAPSERAPYASVPEGDTLGVRHIEEALSDLAFPIRRTDLLARAGRWRIPVTGRVFRTLEEYLDEVPGDEFSSANEVARAVLRHRRRHHA